MIIERDENLLTQINRSGKLVSVVGKNRQILENSLNNLEEYLEKPRAKSPLTRSLKK